MTTHPELIVRYVFVTDAHPGFAIAVDDGRKLLHFESLWIVAADRLDVGHHVVQIEIGKVDDEIFGNHARLLHAVLAGLTLIRKTTRSERLAWNRIVDGPLCAPKDESPTRSSPPTAWQRAFSGCTRRC